jgi:molecular chaperone GrpE
VLFKRKSEEEIREEVDPNLNENVQAGEETVTRSAPEEAETPGTGNGEGMAGNAAEEAKPEEAAEETLEDVQAKLTATAALLKTKEEEATETKTGCCASRRISIISAAATQRSGKSWLRM